MKYYSAIKRNEIMPFAATWMQLEISILSEGKSEREKQIPYDTTYMWNLKYDTNQPICETQSHRPGEQNSGCQGRGGGGGDGVAGRG